MARRSSGKRSARRTRRSSAKRSHRKAGTYAKYVKAHYAAAKRAAGKGAKPQTVFKKIAAMYKKTHKHHGKKHRKH
jgi:hypothetical protein